MSNTLKIGEIETAGRVWIAPMTGISDLPFRRVAASCGAAYVASEMAASQELVRGRPDVVRRAAVGDGLGLTVIQLVGRDPHWMRRGAELAEAAGAQIIDLNFGCPAKSVTGVQCGSALMREPDLFEELVGAVVAAVRVPVTIKTRLGWDDRTINSPELARRAVAVGAKAVTIHGRTRCQFYTGQADWSAVAAVKQAVDTPVLVNGDIIDLASARQALAQSGADGVMIGRAAIGRPWLAAEIDAGLRGEAFEAPGPEALFELVVEHLRDSLEFYGAPLGLKMFRKHLAAYIDQAPQPTSPEIRRAARAALCRLDSFAQIEAALAGLWLSTPRRIAA
ncbi:MAG: tRNA dihydrouridine synthase DusB [Caulobacteraceae bacterium]|nr:tRNA dihydrouridine synthase DusB [Caulobacteraceae bacterium]